MVTNYMIRNYDKWFRRSFLARQRKAIAKAVARVGK